MTALKAFACRKFSFKFLLVSILVFGTSVLLSLTVLLDFRRTKSIPGIAIEQFHFQKCRDWHDYEQMYRERVRVGLGENGAAVRLTNETEMALNEQLYKETGFAVLVSDKISVNRSVPDVRHPECRSFLYPAALPTVSVVIIFHNEVLSVLLRTIHSVVNRTPAELLHEVILVNDCSTNEELYGPLDAYIKDHFGRTRIRRKNLKDRKGLIVTRLEGAEIATGEVLVFFDSHIEVNSNWLPPLLAPIKANRRIATTPSIDNFEPDTFEASVLHTFGIRGGIDWELVYRLFFRKIPEHVDPLLPFPNPIMLGCAFAIDRKFFMEELDGYDREYRIWNAENYELSFKLWLCADGLYEVPCSRVFHTFRLYNPSRSSIKTDFVTRNFKRLVEVWLDDYKDATYSRNPEKYAKVDAGDLTHVKAVRERLKCRNFSYFLEQVAPDIPARFPPVKEVPVFASGQIQSVQHPEVCIDLLGGSDFDPIGLYNCLEVDDPNNIPYSQFFRLNFLKNIVVGYDEHCLDSYKMAVPQCHYAKNGNQYWKYDHVNHLLINSHDDGGSCLAANYTGQAIYMKQCDADDMTQKWKFTHENLTALNDWTSIYGYEKFVYGDKMPDYEVMNTKRDFNPECPERLN